MRSLHIYFSFVFFCILSLYVYPQWKICAESFRTLEAEIPVSCLPIETEETHIYEIVIEPENEIFPVPKSDVLEIKEDDTGKFKIDIHEPGTFVYQIYQKPDNEGNIKYDDTLYIVTVFVETTPENDLHYAISAKIKGKDTKPDNISFQNSAFSEIIPASDQNPVIRTVLTKDTIPLRTIRTAIASAIIMLIALLFRKRTAEDENHHDDK